LPHKSVYKRELGVVLKTCYGPLHNGEFLPVKSFRKGLSGVHKGKLKAICRKCESATKGYDNYIPLKDYRWIYEELVARIGHAETARRLGTGWPVLQRILRRQKYVRKPTIERAVRLLREVRVANEVRHKKSIRHGSTRRNETKVKKHIRFQAGRIITVEEHTRKPPQERKPQGIWDFNRVTSDMLEHERMRKRKTAA